MDTQKRLSSFEYWLRPYTLADIRSYHHCGSTFDGCTLLVKMNNGEVLDFESSTHNWDVEVEAIEQHWKQNRK